MEKNYKTKKEEMKKEKTAGNAVVFETLNSVRFLLRPMKTGSLCSVRRMSAIYWGTRNLITLYISSLTHMTP